MPTVTWASPGNIVYGTTPGAGQLNAFASVPATFSYLPPAGRSRAGNGQTLSDIFTPNDTSD